MGRLLSELKRRHVYRVAAAYVVLAWVLLQVVNNVAPVLDLPLWVARAFLLALVIGFPVALFFAWIRELPASDASALQSPTAKLDYVLAGALIVVIGLVTYQQLASPSAGTTRQASVAPTSSQPTAISLAVLPFANLSGDSSQEFFSDGMTDEIMTALAKVQSLRVIARESAFQFKGERNDMRAVGQALNAQYLINGSVRKDGTRVRITAQLVQADTGVSIWTDSYDRELTSVFATQEDIAQAIAGALRVPLGLRQGQTLVSSRTTNAAIYEDYLRAKALVRTRSGTGSIERLSDAAALLERVVARDPDYAPAWGTLAWTYSLMPIYDPGRTAASVDELRRIVDASYPKAEQAARRAIQLDPNNTDGYLTLGAMESERGRVLLAEDLFKQALALDPNNPDGLHVYRGMLAHVGRLKDALEISQRVQGLEPLVPVFSGNTALVLWLNGQDEAAIALLTRFPRENSSTFARIYAARGDFDAAADALLERTVEPNVPSGTFEEAARLLRGAPATGASLPSLPLPAASFVYAYVGAPERYLENDERNIEAGTLVAITAAQVWHPTYAAVRKTERFKTYVRKAGLVDYWRARGWPDLCRPVGADDFVCD